MLLNTGVCGAEVSDGGALCMMDWEEAECD